MDSDPVLCPQCRKPDNVETLLGRGRSIWRKWGRTFKAPFLSDLNGWHCTECNNYFKEK